MKCCKCKEYNWPDPQDVIYPDPNDENGYCVFHAPARNKGISKIEFNKLITERLNGHHSDSVVFTGAIFPDTFSLIDFGNRTKLPGLNLDHCTFKGRLTFRGATISEKLTCKNAIFEKEVCFARVVFVEYADFSESIFRDAVDFASAVFKKKSFFRAADFRNYATFDDAKFYERASFYSASFKRETRFNSSMFFSKVLFDTATFDGITYFSNTSFGRDLSTAGFIPLDVFNDYSARFSGCKFGENGIYFDGSNLYWCDFLKSDLKNVTLSTDCWPTIDGRYYIPCENSSLELSKNFYQKMKRKYKDEHNEYEASKWHISEKETQLKFLKRSRESLILLLILYLYKIVSGFGENPRKAGAQLFCFLLFTFSLLGFGGISNGTTTIDGSIIFSVDGLINFGTVLMTWFKYVMLLKVDSTQFHPVNEWVHNLVLVLTRLLIPFWAAMFGLAVRNRFRR